jgi:hypothetical protein
MSSSQRRSTSPRLPSRPLKYTESLLSRALSSVPVVVEGRENKSGGEREREREKYDVRFLCFRPPGGNGQHISHLFGPGTNVLIGSGEGAAADRIFRLFGPGTTVLIGPVWFLGLFLDRSDRWYFGKNLKL